MQSGPELKVLSQPTWKQGKVINPDLRAGIGPISIEAKYYGDFIEAADSGTRWHSKTKRFSSWWPVLVELPRAGRPDPCPSERLGSLVR